MALIVAERQRYASNAVMVMAGFTILQAGHVVEHIAQLIQKFVLNMPVAQGLLGAYFDAEWVHFLFNLVTMAGLVVAYAYWRGAGEAVPFALWFALAVQGLHTFEHVAKMYQYYALGITISPKGALGYLFPLIWLHFWLNVPPLLGDIWALVALRRITGRVAAPAVA